MKTMVIGMGGVGSVIAKKLVRTNKFEKVICSDLKKEPIGRVLQYINNDRFEGRILDASNPTELRKAVVKVDHGGMHRC